MKYDTYYQNSAGEKLDLCSIPYLLETANILDFKWDFTTSTNLNSYGGKIDSFTKGITSKKLELSVFAWTEESYKRAINRLVDVLEYDVVNLTPGRLYCNGSYVSCYITSGEIEDSGNLPKWQLAMIRLKYARKGNSGTIEGCSSFYRRYKASISETGVERIILTVSEGNNLLVGCNVHIGTSSDGYQIAKNVTVTAIESPQVGGAVGSLHLTGDAFDLHCRNKAKLLSVVEKHITDGEIGTYNWGIHAGVWNRGFVNRFQK